MQQELSKLGIGSDIVANDSCLFIIEDNSIAPRISEYDFCIYWDKDKYILAMLEKRGVPVFNSYSSITNCDDKMTTYIELADKGFPLLKTIPGLLCYRDEETIKDASVDIVETLGYPLVIKESYGSLGNGVYLVRNREELIKTMDYVKCKPHLFQEYVDTSYGRDLRVIVVGDKAIGGMLRINSTGDFRSNIGSGGCGEPFPLTADMQELSVSIAKALGLVYCGIDFLFGKDGLVVCEVNSNAFFYSFEKTTGINVAKHYAKYIVNALKH